MNLWSGKVSGQREAGCCGLSASPMLLGKPVFARPGTDREDGLNDRSLGSELGRDYKMCLQHYHKANQATS